jgi:hypothetical protein
VWSAFLPAGFVGLIIVETLNGADDPVRRIKRKCDEVRASM